MNLIQQLNQKTTTRTSSIKEDVGGCVGSSGVAAFSMPLFATLNKRAIPKHPRIIKYSSNEIPSAKKKKKTLGIREAFYKNLTEDLSAFGTNKPFDASEVIARLKALENKESVDYRDTSTFGLIDNNNNVVRVTVPCDQAQGFEQDIQHFLGNRNESEQAPEIAELLFKLKDHYTIVNVDWPTVEEDQEEGQELLGMPGEEGDLAGMPGEEGDLAGMPTEPAAGAGKVEDLLTQVIDMMKSDADARKAEAQAREAEAKTKQAMAAREQAMARVKQEEQFLDMDEHNKSQRIKEKEAKRLAQLAKWKHDIASGEEENLPAQEPQYDFLPGEEEEELFRHPSTVSSQQPNKGSTIRGRVTPADVAKYILNRTR